MTSQKPEIFNQTYEHYRAQIQELDLGSIAYKLRCQRDNDDLILPFFHHNFRIIPDGSIVAEDSNRPPIDICVILSKYVLLAPDSPARNEELVKYRNFPYAAPLMDYFTNEVEGAIANYFSGRLLELTKACVKIGGLLSSRDIGSYDLVMEFDTLPTIPVILTFNDQDEDFPASCSILFQKNASDYLDEESLAIVGKRLFEYLKYDGEMVEYPNTIS